MKKIFLNTVAVLVFFIGFTNLVSAQEGAFNNVLVKDLKVDYDDTQKVINGEAVIGNFASQSFNSLTYKLDLLFDEGTEGLGTTVSQKKAEEDFSIPAKGEVIKTFSYEIPKDFPPGEYNFVFQITDLRGRFLGFDHQPITVSQPTENYLAVSPENTKIEINQEDHPWAEGAPAKQGETVKVKFEATNEGSQAINEVVPHLTVYPYTTTLEKIEERDLPTISFKAGEKKELAYKMTNFAKPQSYTAVIELKKDGKLAALPMRGHWVIEGMQGKILSAGINQGKDLLVEIIGSPYSVDETGNVLVQIKDEKGKVYFSQNKKLEQAGQGNQRVSFPLERANFSGKYNDLIIKADLKIGDQLVDSYEKKMSKELMSQIESLKPFKKEMGMDKNKTLFWALVLLAVILILFLIVKYLLKKNNKGKTNVIIFFLLGGLLFGGLVIKINDVKAWRAKVGSYIEWVDTSLGINPIDYWSGTRESERAVRLYKRCLDRKDNDCHPNYYNSRPYLSTLISGKEHRVYYQLVGWSKPHPDQRFDSGQDIRISLSNIVHWCANTAKIGPSTVVWQIFDNQNGRMVKNGSASIGTASRFSKNIGPLSEEGQYTFYMNVRQVTGDWLYHGMIREFNVSSPRPTASLSAKPNPVNYNSSSLLSWEAKNASSCWLEGYGIRGWVNTKDSQRTPNLTSNQTYTINCYGSGGEASDSVRLTVKALNGACGPAASPPNYSYTATSLRGAYCSSGDPSSTTPVLPNEKTTKEETIRWNCIGKNGGSTASCSATRNACVPNCSTCEDNTCEYNRCTETVCGTQCEGTIPWIIGKCGDAKGDYECNESFPRPSYCDEGNPSSTPGALSPGETVNWTCGTDDPINCKTSVSCEATREKCGATDWIEN